jgi:serine/threonine-protein kinase RsbT
VPDHPTNTAPLEGPVRGSLRPETLTEAGEHIIRIESEADIVNARQMGRTLGAEVGFRPGELALIATAISELARNIVLYAGRGEIVLLQIAEGSRRGLMIAARDQGPGIQDLTQAMRDGFSTSGGLGLGLPGVKRLMDEFGITSAPGRGTTVTGKKWKR